MMRTRIWLAALTLALFACDEPVVDSVPQDDAEISTVTPAPIVYTSDTFDILPEDEPAGSAPWRVGEPGDHESINLIGHARIPAPVVGGSTVQANDIVIDGSVAYIAYNYQGGPWIGAIQAINIADPTTPVPMYQVNFASMDVNALGIDGDRLLITGAADPTIWDDLTTPAFAAHASRGSPDGDDIAATVMGLPSFAGTGITRQGSSYYVGVGAEDGGIQSLGTDFSLSDFLDMPDVRDVDSYAGGIIAIAGTTHSDNGSGRVIVGDISSHSVLPLGVDFGSDFHKATIEVFEGYALLGLSEEGFKVLELSSPGSFLEEIPNPAPNVAGQQTNTNSVSTNGEFIVTANGEYGFRIMQPNEGDFSDIVVTGYFASQYPPPDATEAKFSVNHVEMDAEGCLYVAAGAWGVYVYCIENQLPQISLSKSADPTEIGWQSGGLGDFDPDRTFVENTDDDGGFIFPDPTCDDEGPDDEPAQVDFNCMGRADNVDDLLGVQWTWDATNVWQGQGQTGDGCALLDTNENGDADYALCVRIENDENGDVVQIDADGNPAPGAAIIYSCGDNRDDRCAQQVAELEDVGSSTCSVEVVDDAFPGRGGASNDDHENDVKALCELDLTLDEFSAAPSVNLLNVCAFPSGEPNSNPFDCVVTPGVGFIQIMKTVDPDIVDLFGFTLTPGSTDGTDTYAVQSGVTTALIPVLPGDGISLTETVPSGWSLDDASCTVSDDDTGTLDGNTVGSIEVRRGQTTLCTFANVASESDEVTYTIVITNTGLEAVSLDTLVDDIFGDLNGEGTCSTDDVSIDADGGQYTCTFTVTLDGQPGDTHTNTVTATVSDDDGPGEASDSETVTWVIVDSGSQ